MSEIKEKPNKQALLKDLENIRDSLSEGEFEGDIPILTDSIFDEAEDAESDAPDDALIYDEKRIFDDDFHQFDDEDKSGEDTNDVVLLDMYEDDDVADEEEALRAAYRESIPASGPASRQRQAQVLEGQQSLFDNIHETGIRESLVLPEQHQDFVLPAATGENPFLPKHIRDRLTQGKNSFLEEIALVNESLKRAPAKSADAKPEIKAPLKPAQNKIDYQKVADELVKEFLPQLEAALRKRIIQILAEKEK